MGGSDENSHVVVADLSVGSCGSVVRARFQERIYRSNAPGLSFRRCESQGRHDVVPGRTSASLSQANAELGNFNAQFKRVFDKIKTTLSQGGATFDDIVTMSVFLTDLRYIPEFNKLSKEIFKKNFPAITFVEVSHLARPQLIMEIQPIAVIP